MTFAADVGQSSYCNTETLKRHYSNEWMAQGKRGVVWSCGENEDNVLTRGVAGHVALEIMGSKGSHHGLAAQHWISSPALTQLQPLGLPDCHQVQIAALTQQLPPHFAGHQAVLLTQQLLHCLAGPQLLAVLLTQRFRHALIWHQMWALMLTQQLEPQAAEHQMMIHQLPCVPAECQAGRVLLTHQSPCGPAEHWLPAALMSHHGFAAALTQHAARSSLLLLPLQQLQAHPFVSRLTCFAIAKKCEKT